MNNYCMCIFEQLNNLFFKCFCCMYVCQWRSDHFSQYHTKWWTEFKFELLYTSHTKYVLFLQTKLSCNGQLCMNIVYLTHQGNVRGNIQCGSYSILQFPRVPSVHLLFTIVYPSFQAKQKTQSPLCWLVSYSSSCRRAKGASQAVKGASQAVKVPHKLLSTIAQATS